MALFTEADRDHARQIALLNDSFRTTFVGGTICITAGVQLVGEDFVQLALGAARSFVAFNEDGDPHHEHDFGAMKVSGHDVFWKIDYYDPTLTRGSEDPASLALTRRVLTVMLAEEY
jgi:hypothetical protein